jgi:hypothetical protein
MQQIGTHGLACLDDSDYADYARFMQCQAEALDALLFEQLTLLTDFMNLPTMIVRPSALRNIAIGATVEDLFNTVLYVNNDFMTLSTVGSNTYINIGSPVGSAVVAYPRGLYLAGAHVPMDATGGVTAFSERRTTIAIVDDTAPPLEQQLAFAWDVNPDANTTITGIDTNPTLSVVLRGTNGVRLTHAVTHTNAASSVDVTPFTDTYLWVTYVGPDELVEAT